MLSTVREARDPSSSTFLFFLFFRVSIVTDAAVWDRVVNDNTADSLEDWARSLFGIFYFSCYIVDAHAS